MCGANNVMQSLALVGLYVVVLVDNWCYTRRWEHSWREVGWYVGWLGGRVLLFLV